MADYHPLIARAVAGLDDNTAEARRSLYERARSALLKQLRGTTPPLSESDITRERLALEEAIRKVEAEQARRGRLERVPPASAPPESAEAQPSPDAHVAATAAAPPAAGPPLEPPSEEPQVRQPRQAVANAPVSAPKAPPAEVATPEPGEEQPPPYAPPSERPAMAAAAGEAEPTALNKALRKLRGRFKSSEGRESGEESQLPPMQPPSAPSRRVREVRDLDAIDAPLGRRASGREAVARDASAGARREAPDMAKGFPEPDMDRAVEDHLRRRFSVTAVNVIIAVVVLAVLGALVVVGYREGGNLVALFQIFRSQPPTVTREQARTPPKIEDRVGSAQPDRLPGGGQLGAGPGAQAPAVAQRVILYEEEPSDPAGKRYIGSAIWRTETVSPGPGLAPELAVKASIEIPERQIAMMFSMVRNTDPKLPASHTIDIRFNLPPGFSGGGIANVPGILMKQAEQTRGVPLAGIAVKVTDNVFLIGLSSVKSDVERNTQLLKERTWFDIPIVYANGSRAILAMEKGTPGERAFNDAFTVWGRAGTAAR